MKFHFCASQAPNAQKALKELTRIYKQTSVQDCDVIVPLGGDGFLLQTLHETQHLNKPVYGLNKGTVGFLMNSYSTADLNERVQKANDITIRPLDVLAQDVDGQTHNFSPINDASLLRSSGQAANLKIRVNGVTQMDKLICDGIVLSTPAGSTAYNSSNNGPILPITANVLSLTAIAPFKPKQWRGAVLPMNATVEIDNLDPIKRPLMASADGESVYNIAYISMQFSKFKTHRLLFDQGHSLEARILKEQFH